MLLFFMQYLYFYYNNFTENSMVKFRKWLRWSNPTTNKNVPRVLVILSHIGRCMVYTVYLQSNLSLRFFEPSD